jgi:two-component system CheB/CheR fusion protein
LLEANATALERGGLGREDVINRKFWDTWWWNFSEESQDRLKDAIARAAKGETVRYDVPARMAGGEMLIIDFQLVPDTDETGKVTQIIPSAVDVNARVEAERRKDMLLAELEHRVKNILATVQSVARFTARMAKDKDELAEGLINRLGAISRTHDALTSGGWQSQSLRSLVMTEVSPYVDPDDKRFVYSGGDLQLEPNTALLLGLALHELATNAAKYGAFSNENGRVEFNVELEDGAFSSIVWQEFDGPVVEEPDSEGFGTFLIQQLLVRELNASIDIDYAEAGLRCVITRNDDED